MALLLLGLAPVAVSQEPTVVPEYPACIPANGHGIVRAVASAPSGLSSIRTYFRAAGKRDLSYLDMRPAEAGVFWAVLPKPVEDTESVELQVMASDAAGNVVQSEWGLVEVTAGCTASLTPEQLEASRHLVVGETMEGQSSAPMEGFRCDGIAMRVDVNAVMRVGECWEGSPTLLLPRCSPPAANTLIAAVVSPAWGWSSVRAYFRALGTTDPYYQEMRGTGDGVYWAVLPRPEGDTPALEVQLAVTDAAGQETRTAWQLMPVTQSCASDLTPDQLSFARNLVVGDTVPGQFGEALLGFLCDGIALRVNTAGEMRPEECCCGPLLLYADKRPLIPLLILGGGGVVIVTSDGGDEVSKPRP